MPTISAPSSSQVLPERPESKSLPLTPLSSSQIPKARESTIAAVLFIISLLLLCLLVTIFIVKSTKTYELEAPILTVLPEITNKKTLLVEGKGPKKSVIEISSDNTSYFVDSDVNGDFSMNLETRNDGKSTYFAIARKKILFIKFESERSNEIFTVVDKTSPNIKIVSLPKIITSSSYTVKGSTSEPAKMTIKVNKLEYFIETGKANSFSFPIKLQKGVNTVHITAKDLAGNETSTAALSTTYATGSVYIGTVSGTKQLPNSSGDLVSALSTAFGRFVAISSIIIGILGFFASSGFVSLYRMAKHEV